MKRAEATKRIDGLLERVASGEGRYLPLVREIAVFGSYSRGALEVGDVDLAVEFDQTPDERARWFVDLTMNRIDHRTRFRRELCGSQRVLQVQFNQLKHLRADGFEPKLLWRRGDSLERARARLRRIKPDPSAGSAPRDGVHPLLAGENRIPRPAHEQFALFLWAGWIEATLVELPREQATNPTTIERFSWQWSESNPRFETAHAVARYLERDGIAPLEAGSVLGSDERVGGEEFGPSLVTVHFGACYLEWALLGFSHGVPRVVHVLNPSAHRQPLRALDMHALVDDEAFLDFRDPDGRAKMRGEVAEAARAGTLPEWLRGVARQGVR